MAIISVDIIDYGPKKNGQKFKADGKKRKIVIGKRQGEKIGSHDEDDNFDLDRNRRREVKTRIQQPLKVPDLQKERTKLDFDTHNWHRFGADNLFPDGLAALNRQANNNRSILHWKAIYTTGNGFTSDDESLLEYFKQINTENDTFRSFFKKTIQDYNGFGNVYVEVVTDSLNTFTWLFQWDPTKVRLGSKDRQGFAGFFPDWRKVEGRQSQIKWVPLYPNFEEGDDGLQHSILHIRDYEPQFPNYGLPSWVGGMDAAAIGFKTNRWNLTRLDNQFQSSGILEIFGEKGDKKLLEQLNKFKERRVGEGRNSQLLTITRERGGNEKTIYTPLTTTNEGDWINLHKQSDQEMVIAHNWFRSLSGLGEPGQLGNTQQIRNEYDIARSTVIPEIQNVILDALKTVFELGGFNADTLEVINQSPVGIADRIDPNFVLNRQQGYDILGIEAPEGDPDLQKVINTNKGKVEEIKLQDGTPTTD